MTARAGLSRLMTVGIGTATIVAVLAAWAIGSGTGAISSNVLPHPGEVGAAFAQILGEPGSWLSVWQTLSSTLLGLVIVGVIALPLAVAIGTSAFVADAVWIPIEFLKPIPPVALIPLALLVWGPDETMKLFLVCFGSVWPLLTQLVYGVREVDGVALRTARVYRFGRLRTLGFIVVPSLLPFAMTGLRVSASIALIVSIVAELVGGAPGLGKEIALSSLAGQDARMLAFVIITGLLGLLVNAVFRRSERFLLFWHQSQREVRS